MNKTKISGILLALIASSSLSLADNSVIEPSAVVYDNAINPYMTTANRSITSYGATVLGAYNNGTGEYSNLLGNMPSDTPIHIDVNHNGYWDDVPYALPMIVTWNGTKYVANGYYATVTGEGARVDGYGTSAYGTMARANGIAASTYGYEGSASTHYASNFGSFGSASGFASSSFGAYGSASGDYSLNAGVFGSAAAEYSTTLGFMATTTNAATNSVASGAFSKATTVNEFSVGNATTSLTRRITNVSTPIDATDATNKSYVDTAILNINAGGGMDYAYVDASSQASNTYADQGDARTLQASKDYTDSKISEVKQELRKEMHESTALAIALSTPAVIENGKDNSMSIGVGQYKSAAAIGVSYSRRATRDTFINFGVSAVGQSVASRASYNLSF